MADFTGTIIGVQPRIFLSRSFDERSHSYLGYLLMIDGIIDGTPKRFTLGVGPKAHEKFRFMKGQAISGACQPAENPELEPAEYYKAIQLKISANPIFVSQGPPWHTIAPPLTVYRERGHRRLSVRTYESTCEGCVWGCQMAVEMIIDQWNPRIRKYRRETFCYGPLSCKSYKSGPARQVPGRKGMVYVEEDWVDEQSLGNREED